MVAVALPASAWAWALASASDSSCKCFGSFGAGWCAAFQHPIMAAQKAQRRTPMPLMDLVLAPSAGVIVRHRRQPEDRFQDRRLRPLGHPPKWEPTGRSSWDAPRSRPLTWHVNAAKPKAEALLRQANSVLLDRYMRAFQTADVPALIELLRDDAVMSMPPDPTWFRGREAIGAFFTRWVFPVGGSLGNALSGAGRELHGPRLVPTAANRQPAFAIYQRAEDGSFRALALQVLTTRAGLVSDITGFVAPELFPYFDLPSTYRGR